MKLQELRLQIEAVLKPNYSASESKAILMVYLEDKLGINRFSKDDESDAEIPEDLKDEINSDILQLSKGVPVQYVTGIQWFWGEKYLVTPDVLIPRPETEELVVWISEQYKTLQVKLKILDIGTGTGCIPISLKLKMPSADVFATDISPKAIHVAKLNAARLDADVTFIQDDILNSAFDPVEKFDLIISNPPYIPKSEGKLLDKNVMDNEPHLALFVSDEDPLIFYKAILNYAKSNLKPFGHIFFEIHKDFGADIIKLPEMESFEQISLHNDISGNPRFVRAVLREQNIH